jgi:hypothetical protein
VDPGARTRTRPGATWLFDTLNKKIYYRKEVSRKIEEELLRRNGSVHDLENARVLFLARNVAKLY